MWNDGNFCFHHQFTPKQPKHWITLECRVFEKNMTTTTIQLLWRSRCTMHPRLVEDRVETVVRKVQLAGIHLATNMCQIKTPIVTTWLGWLYTRTVAKYIVSYQKNMGIVQYMSYVFSVKWPIHQQISHEQVSWVAHRSRK